MKLNNMKIYCKIKLYKKQYVKIFLRFLIKIKLDKLNKEDLGNIFNYLV